MILGSKATFSFSPSTDEIKQYLAKEKKIVGKKILSLEVTEEDRARVKKAMIEAEQQRPLYLRKTQGDASETGIIKFAQAIRDIEEYRSAKPVFSYVEGGQ
jgi:hypothetical protein